MVTIDQIGRACIGAKNMAGLVKQSFNENVDITDESQFVAQHRDRFEAIPLFTHVRFKRDVDRLQRTIRFIQRNRLLLQLIRHQAKLTLRN